MQQFTLTCNIEEQINSFLQNHPQNGFTLAAGSKKQIMLFLADYPPKQSLGMVQRYLMLLASDQYVRSMSKSEAQIEENPVGKRGRKKSKPKAISNNKSQ